MTWIPSGGEKNFNTLMHYYAKQCDNANISNESENDAPKARNNRQNNGRNFTFSLATTVALVPQEFLAAAENLIRLPFTTAGAVTKIPVALAFYAAKVICCGNSRFSNKMIAWQRQLPGILDVLKTAYKVIGFVIGAIFTATLGFISTKANYKLHALCRLIDVEMVDPLIKSMEKTREELQSAQQTVSELSQRVETLQASLEENEGQIGTINQQKKVVEAERERLKTTIARLEATIAELRAKPAEPPAKKLSTLEMLAQLERTQEFHQLLSDMLGSNADLDGLRQANQDLDALRQRMAREGVRFNDPAAILALAEKYKLQALALQTQLTEQKSKFETQLRDLNADKVTLTQHLEASKRNLQNTTKQVEAQKAEIERLRTEVSKHVGQIQELQGAQRELTGQAQAQKQLMGGLQRQIGEKTQELQNALKTKAALEEALRKNSAENSAEIARLKKSLETVEQRKAQLEEELPKLRAAQSAKEVEISKLSAQLREAQFTFGTKEAEFTLQKSNLESQIRKKQGEIESSKQAIAVTAQVQGTSEETKRLAAELEKSKNALEVQLEQLRTQNEANVKSHESEKAALTKEVEMLNAEIRSKSQELESASKSKVAIEETISKQSGKIAESAAETERLRSLLNTAEESRTKLQQQIEELQAQCAAKDTANSQMQSSVSEMKSLSASKDQSLEKLNQEMAELQKRITSIANRIKDILTANTDPEAIDVAQVLGMDSAAPVDMIEGSLQVVNDRLVFVKTAEQRIQSQEMLLRDEITQRDEKLSELSKEKARAADISAARHRALEHELSELRRSKETEVHAENSELLNLKRELESVRKQYQEKDKLFESILKENQQLLSNVDDRKEKDAALQKAKQEAATMQVALKRLEEQREKAREEMESAKFKANQLQDIEKEVIQLRKAQKDHQAADENARAAEDECLKQVGKARRLEQENHRLEETNAELQAELKKAALAMALLNQFNALDEPTQVQLSKILMPPQQTGNGSPTKLSG